MTASIIYEGNLRCVCTHIQSGTVTETDAPTDNRGMGARFSPTDTLCVSLATCIITTMGIRAADMQVDLTDTQMEVTKHMLADPRRVGAIDIILNIPRRNTDEKNSTLLQMIGNNCPVMKSIHPDIKVNITYNWL